MNEVTPRPEVAWFAKRMERKLQLNDHKPHWSKSDIDELMYSLAVEYSELLAAIEKGAPVEIINEAADAANFAMMINDDCGQRGEGDGGMNTGEVYRVFGSYPNLDVYADIKIAGFKDNLVLCQRLKDGKIVEVDKRNFERMRKQRLDESAAFGNDCRGGVCD